MQQFFWEITKTNLINQFKTENFIHGIIQSVKILGEKLEKYFPSTMSNPDELSNEVTVG